MLPQFLYSFEGNDGTSWGETVTKTGWKLVIMQRKCRIPVHRWVTGGINSQRNHENRNRK
jgi:hypothetical protein